MRRILQLSCSVILLTICSVPSLGQVIKLADGNSIQVKAKFNKPIRFGPAQLAERAEAVSGVGLPFYTTSFDAFGKALPLNIIGTDPSLGVGTTVLQTVLVPLNFAFVGAGNPTLDGSNIVLATLNSPIYQVADYTTGGVHLGSTQYADAIQRAEFWNLSGFSHNYHVLLASPAIAQAVTIQVPTEDGAAEQLLSGGFAGLLDIGYFDSIVAGLLPSLPANVTPIFLTDNVFLVSGGTCCVLGFHSSQGPPIATAKTWIYAAYVEPGTFVDNVFEDVQGLSHEVAEWINDPFVGTPLKGGINLIPPAILPGQGGACIVNFETGDPLEAGPDGPAAFPVATNGKTYHVQDEAFLAWFLHGPSFSANGWYSYLGTFMRPSSLCGPG